MLSVPVTSLNRYCANLKISRLHLFLQLIFAPDRVGGAGAWKGQHKISKEDFYSDEVPRRECPLLSCAPPVVSAWPLCVCVAAVMIMSEWGALEGGSSGALLRGKSVCLINTVLFFFCQVINICLPAVYLLLSGEW